MKDIKDLTLDELKKELAGLGEPSYRAKQIFSWLYHKGADDFDLMNNLPAPLKDKLKNKYSIGKLELTERLKSVDKTEKFLFKLADGNFIETVLIYTSDRATVCLSTQVGCKFACSFCASGLGGFTRDLAPSEITGQILFLCFGLKRKITNYVFMGMGEPLDNYDNVSRAILIMNDPKGMNIGSRRITVSTCGLVPGIRKLKDLGLQVNLSVSLHAANSELRDEVMPVNKRYPLRSLIEACESYIAEAGRMITFEYVLIRGKNDSLKDADELGAIAKRLRAKVNLIPYSAVPGLCFQPPLRKDIKAFAERISKKGARVTLRESKGGDIQAACGQLSGEKT
ncbi:MAG: 23S rRNA (adenine(2503)-C(2))-methyltransferase RlmN [Candidatus Omnitrophota bacterium]